MNILNVKYALEIAETGSINKAAKNLYMSQPHLSMLLKTLEDDIGIAIFTRSKKGMALTVPGKDFLDNMRPIISELDSIQSRYYSQRDEKGTIKISSLRSSLFMDGMHKMFLEDKEQYFHISYFETGFFRVLENVKNGTSDIGFLFCHRHTRRICREIVETAGLSYHPFGRFETMIVASEKTELPGDISDVINELRRYVYIAYDEFENSILSLGNEHKMLNLPAPSRIIYVSDRDTLYTLLEDEYTYTISHKLTQRTKNKHKIKEIKIDHFMSYGEASYIKKKATPLNEGTLKIINKIGSGIATMELN